MDDDLAVIEDYGQGDVTRAQVEARLEDWLRRLPWGIATNCRINLYTSQGWFDLVDRAALGATPRWTIFGVTESRDGDLFEPDMIAKIG